MDTQAIEKLTESVGQITKGFDELKNAHEVLKSTGGEGAKKMIDEVAEKLGAKLEAIQTQQQKLEAALNRPGVKEGDDAKDAQKKLESKALTAYLRGGDKGFAALSPEEQKALSTDSNPDGGYFVPSQNLGIINGRIFETSPMRKIAAVRATAAKSVTFDLDDQEAGATWEGEGTSNPDTTTPKTGQIEIVARKLTAEPSITEEDLQDSMLDVEAWLNGKVAEYMGRKENTAFISGNGAVQPRGILTYDAWTTPGTYQRNALEQLSAGSTSAVSADNLIDLQGALIEDYQDGANWSMNRATLTQIMKLNGSTNYRFLNLQPAVGPQGQVLGAVMSLLEKPVVLMKDMPVATSNALSVAYGNFSRGYTIVDRVGISVLRDPYTSKGKVKYRSMKRVGGAVTNFEAIKLLKMA